MEDHPDIDQTNARRTPVPALAVRLPSRRLSALAAAAMLGIGLLVGAAIGPAPEASLAGNSIEVTKRLLLLAAIASEKRSETAAAASTTSPTPTPTPTGEPSEPPAPASTAATKAAGSPSSSEEESSSSEEAGSGEEAGSKKKPALPPVSNVWLIELSGSGFAAALTQPTASPFIAQAVGQGTLLSGWSALTASAFASETAIIEPPSAVGTPPLMHTIVQPPCPEGSAGAACASETPGQLTSADEFLKATLATITSTPAYKEHGLVVVTFTTVGLASQAGLPEGASSATLTYQPPAGALLLSPFAKAGRHATAAFDPTSPRKSIELLLHK